MLQGAPYSLGRFGYVINGITFVWIILATILFCMPTTATVEPTTMNYASVVFFFFFVLSAAWWFIWGNKHYVGPLGAAPEDLIHPKQAATDSKLVAETSSHDSDKKDVPAAI